jgi:hypothetical protein
MTDKFDAGANREAEVAARLVLAQLNDDDDAISLTLDQINGCADCWRGIAIRLSWQAAAYARLHLGHQQAIAETERAITGCLDAAEGYD